VPIATNDALLDIVVLVHDQADWADLCIRSVERFTANKYHLIIIDSASVEEKTKNMLHAAEARGHTVIRLKENRSFSHGCNIGINAGRSRYIVILNDDCIVTEGWDSALLQDASPKRVGLVGARSNYAAGAQGGADLAGQDPPWLVFVCVCLRREVWEALGPMDEVTFDGFNSEDIDYSWHVRKAGLQLKLSNAYVLHAGSRTLAAKLGAFSEIGNPLSTTEARIKNDQKYNARLIDKWGKEWCATHFNLQQRGLVATFHATEMTRVGFMHSLMGLKRSDGIGFSYYQHQRSPIAQARQVVADYATDQGFDWIVQLDDDATFPEDLIRRLLSHQKEIVCALAYGRAPPHITCAFEFDPVGDGMSGKPLEGIEHTGLRRVDVSGFHCSIMHTSVIKKLRAFKSEKYPNGIRQYYGGFDNKMGEDFACCVHLKEAGIPIYVDTDLIAGHIGDAVLVDEGYKQSFVASTKRV
jgi:GT2 family glycosyltransferase